MIDPDIKPMSQDVWNAGAEYQLASNTVVGVNYIHTDLNRTIEDVGTVVNGSEVYLYCNPGENLLLDGAHHRGDRALPDPEAHQELRRPRGVHQSPLRPQLVPGRQLRPEPPLRELRGHGQHRRGDDRRPPATRWRSNRSARRRAPGSNVTRSWDLDELMFDSRGNLVEGLLATDRPHVFKLYGSYRFGFGTNVGVNFYAGSGTPVSKVVRTRHGVLPFRRRPRVARPHGLPDQHRPVPEPGHQAGRRGAPAAAGAQRPQRLRSEAGAAHLQLREPHL